MYSHQALLACCIPTLQLSCFSPWTSVW
jgi:hypothetical protein